MKGQNSVSASAIRNDSSYSGKVEHGLYTLTGLWLSGLRVSDYSVSRKEMPSVEHLQVDVQSSYLFRILSDRSRRLCLYAGGGMFLGYEFYDPFDRTADLDRETYGKGSVAYGISADMQAEFFLMRRVALVLQGSVPVNVISGSGWLHYGWGAGIRINL